jgi:hypothetical protein
MDWQVGRNTGKPRPTAPEKTTQGGGGSARATILSLPRAGDRPAPMEPATLVFLKSAPEAGRWNHDGFGASAHGDRREGLALAGARTTSTARLSALEVESGGAARKVRRPVRALTGALLILLAALGGAALLTSSDHRVPVLVVARPVAAGQRLVAGDLGTRLNTPSGPRLLSPADTALVVGRDTVVALNPGDPVLLGELAPASRPPAGTVELPLALKEGTFPPELAAGQQVLIVAGPTNATGTPQPPPAPVPATVDGLAVEHAFGSSSATTVTVQVPASALERLVAADLAGSLIVAAGPSS